MKNGRVAVFQRTDRRVRSLAKGPDRDCLNLLGLLEQTGHDPRLGLRDRARFGDLDHVAHLVLALFVMGVVLGRLGDDLAVELVLGAAHDLHGDRLRALVADDLADQRAGVLRLGLGLDRGGGGAHLAASFFFCARMVLARAMSRRVLPSTVWLLRFCVAFCMRRPKWAFSRSATSFSRPATSLARSSDAFIEFLQGSRAHLARDEGGLQRQLGSCQEERFASQHFGDAVEFVKHLARLDFSDAVLGVALAVAHADFGRLLRDRLVGKDADEDTPAALDVARDGTACGFDLASRDAAALGGLEAEVAERHLRATRGDAGVAALLFLAEFSACRLQHVYSPLPSPLGGVPAGATALRTRLTAGVLAASAPASAGLAAPSTAGAVP